MPLDPLCRIPIGVEQHLALLVQHARMIIPGIEAPVREIALHCLCPAFISAPFSGYRDPDGSDARRHELPCPDIDVLPLGCVTEVAERPHLFAIGTLLPYGLPASFGKLAVA